MRFPSSSPVALDWPKAASEQWAQLVVRSRRLEASVGRGDAFEGMLAKLRAMASTGKFGGLRELLRRRIAARALTWLWLEGDPLVLRLFNSTMLDALVDAQKPRLTRITFLQLVQLYFREFDCLDAREGQSSAGLRKALEEHLFWQLAEIPASRYATGRPDAISALKREAHWLIGADGPRELATRTRSDGKELSVAFAQLGLSGFDVGRYGDVCRAHFYLQRLRELSVGQWDEVFDELLKSSVAKSPFEGDLRIGHAALELLIDRAGTDPGDAWQSFILGLAGDPRISSRAASYQEWWRPIGEERIQRVRGWLSKEDLRLFLQAVDQYGKEAGKVDLQRMFPARKVFLEGLFKQGLIRSTRLMLGRVAHDSVRRILSSEVKTNFARMDGPMADKAVIYLDCGNFHLIEGSHSFKIWVYLALPSTSLLSYDKSSFTHAELTVGIAQQYRMQHSGLPYEAVAHLGNWQKRVFEFLANNGIGLDIEKMLTARDYRNYRAMHGLPVVDRRIPPHRSSDDVGAAKANVQAPVSDSTSTRVEPRSPAPDLVAEESRVEAEVSPLAGLSEFELKVLQHLADHPGQKIRRAAIDLGVNSLEVNRVVYGPLKKFCTQDRDYGWSVNEEVMDALEKYPEG